MISEFMVRSYFAQAKARGWGLRSVGSLAAGWNAVYHGRLRDYAVYLNLDDDWVYLQCLLLQVEPRPECRTALHEYLLRLNDEIFFGKIALNRSDHPPHTNESVVLIVESPIEGFGAGAFRLMTEAVATYAEEYAREIEAIALDPNVASLSSISIYDHVESR